VPRISVLLSEADAQRFAAYCEQKGHKKSTLAARLIREHLDRECFSVQLLLPAMGRRPRALRRSAKQRKTDV
jgi:hypothetical protein